MKSLETTLNEALLNEALFSKKNLDYRNFIINCENMLVYLNYIEYSNTKNHLILYETKDKEKRLLFILSDDRNTEKIIDAIKNNARKNENLVVNFNYHDKSLGKHENEDMIIISAYKGIFNKYYVQFWNFNLNRDSGWDNCRIIDVYDIPNISNIDDEIIKLLE